MTESQAYQFWSEWLAFKERWGIDVVVTIDETCDARFADGSFIAIDDRQLSIGDLKNKDVPLQVSGPPACAIETTVGDAMIRYVGRTPEEVLKIQEAAKVIGNAECSPPEQERAWNRLRK